MFEGDSVPKGFVIQRGDDRVTLVLPFDRDFVDQLKMIPARWRAWDAAGKCWTVRSPYHRQAVDLAAQHFQLEFVKPAMEETPRPRTETHSSEHCLSVVRTIWPEHATLYLLPGAPPELVKSAYRCLALLHHPDHGGDTETMKTINAAYEKLRN
jgi:hypothetical protein